MLRITYENELGRLDLNGGQAGKTWRILEMDGMGLPPKNLQAASYPGSVGQRTLSETVDARTITVTCDIGAYGASGPFAVSNAMKILNSPGTLMLRDGYKTRKISARCTQAAQGERQGGYRVLAVQFVCDYPYFEDARQTDVPIFQRGALLGGSVRWYKDNSGAMQSEPIAAGSWKLPCAFSIRTSAADVLNLGDVDTEPVFRITMQGEPQNGEDSGALLITNAATGQTLKLHCDGADGDVIVIDIPNRSITNQDGDNLISCLSPDSYLSDFWLTAGTNQISVENHMSLSCVVECAYSNKYVEAVMA